MKDHNGGDIPGTVLKSINASDRLEKAITGWFAPVFGRISARMLELGVSNPDFYPNNAPASGINSQETLKTRVQ